MIFFFRLLCFFLFPPFSFHQMPVLETKPQPNPGSKRPIIGREVRRRDWITGAALLENNEAATELTTANGGTFTWAQLDSVANHVTARSIGDWRALTWLATATGELDVNVPPFAVVSLSVSTRFDTTWIEGTASRLYMCKSVEWIHLVSAPLSRH